MAILDLWRRRRPDEDDEDEGLDGAGDDGDEDEDEGPPRGLLGRFASVPGLGRVVRRSADEEDAGDADDDDEDEDAGSGGSGLLGRLASATGLGRVLRRGGNDDEDEDDGDFPVAAAASPGAASPPGPLAGAIEQQTGEDQTASLGAAGLDEQSTVPEAGEGLPREEESELESEEEGGESPTTALRLRELARCQEDVPAGDLADEVQALLDLLDRRRG